MSSLPTIHVIDDDHAVRDSPGTLIECHGFPIQLYASAASFLNRGAVEGCLLTDLDMPGITGLELLNRLRDRGVAIPSIIMTGRLRPSIEEAIGQVGAILLEKPFQPGELLAALQKVLDTKSGKKPETVTTVSRACPRSF